MMVAAARQRLTLIGVNLWQTGIRSLFRYYQFKADLDQDQAWSLVRVELEELCPDSEEWEYQLIRAILYEEHNITLDEAKAFYELHPNDAPLIKAMERCIAKAGIRNK